MNREPPARSEQRNPFSLVENRGQGLGYYIIHTYEIDATVLLLHISIGNRVELLSKVCDIVSKRNETLSSVLFPFRFSIFGNESLPFRFRFYCRNETETKRKR